MTTLTRWLLQLFDRKWPGGIGSDNLTLIDRDNAQVVSWSGYGEDYGEEYGGTFTNGRRSMDFDLTTSNVIGVAYADADKTPSGLGGNEYRVENTLSVRIEGASVYRSGFIEDAADFLDLVQTASDIVREADNGDVVVAPGADYHVVEPDNAEPFLSDHKDYFEWRFDVEPRGYRQL